MSEESRGLGEGPAASQAADWFARLGGGAATGEDWLAFESWLAVSPAHAAAYGRLESLWIELDEGRAAILAELDAASTRPQPRRAGRRSSDLASGSRDFGLHRPTSTRGECGPVPRGA